MSETVEKDVVINFVGRNLIRETADEITVNMRGVAMQFQMAAYSVNFLNKEFLGGSEAGKVFAGALHTVGAALRIVTIVESMSKALQVLTASSWATTVAENARAVAHTIAGAASTVKGEFIAFLASIASSSWAVTIAENARALASAVANAVSSMGVAVPIMIAAAAAVTVGLSAYLLTRGRQFGGLITETGPYLLHAKEFVTPGMSMVPSVATPAPQLLTIPQSETRSVTLNLDARGSTFAGDYDVDKMMDRVTDRLKRAGVIER